MLKPFIVAAAFFIASAHALTVEEVKDIVVRYDVKTISDLLSRLPADYRSEFTLIMKSQSLQEASVQFPRVIMQGQDGRLLMAFNGDPSQKGYDNLELIQFRDGQDRFDFFEIRFPETDSNGRPLNNLTKAEISARNPAKCLACHTSDPRPNWPHYSNWPGAFLGADDSVSVEPDLPGFTSYLPRLQNEFPQHLRYKHLDKVLEGYQYDGYRYGNRNIRTTERIYRLNYLRVGRLLRDTPYYTNYKYMIAGIIGCFDADVSAYLPAGFPPFGTHSYDFVNLFYLRNLFVHDLYPAFKTMDPQWTIPSFVSPGFSYGIIHGDSDLEALFNISSNDYYGFKGPIAETKNCPTLQAKSRQALSSVPYPDDEIAVREQSQPKILKRCMECHTSKAVNLVGPHIPFDNVKRLKAHLNYPGYPRGKFYDEAVYRISAVGTEKMPPEGMGEQDRKELVEYFRSVK